MDGISHGSWLRVRFVHSTSPGWLQSHTVHASRAHTTFTYRTLAILKVGMASLIDTITNLSSMSCRCSQHCTHTDVTLMAVQDQHSVHEPCTPPHRRRRSLHDYQQCMQARKQMTYTLKQHPSRSYLCRQQQGCQHSLRGIHTTMCPVQCSCTWRSDHMADRHTRQSLLSTIIIPSERDSNYNISLLDAITFAVRGVDWFKPSKAGARGHPWPCAVARGID